MPAEASIDRDLVERIHLAVVTVALLAAGSPLAAQERLTLAGAIERARASHPSLRAAAAREREAAEETARARASHFPRVDVTESWQRGDLPTFTFSSLVSQRRLTEDRFTVDALNHPEPVNGLRTAVRVEQVLFDGASRSTARLAALSAESARIERRRAEAELVVATTEAYGHVLLFDALSTASTAALTTVEQDLTRATSRREAGAATNADVLGISVHLARTKERQIQAAAEARIARARLNALVGAPLDARFALDAETVPKEPMPVTAALESGALAARPELQLAQLDERAAAAAVSTARAAFLPQLGLRGVWQLDGPSFADRESSWVVGTEIRVNLFSGLADKARLAQAKLAAERRRADRERVENDVRLEIHAAAARLDAALARAAAATGIVEQARESERITRNRYETGLADVVALVQASQAALDAEAQAVAARVDALVQHAALQRALGR